MLVMTVVPPDVNSGVSSRDLSQVEKGISEDGAKEGALTLLFSSAARLCRSPVHFDC